VLRRPFDVIYVTGNFPRANTAKITLYIDDIQITKLITTTENYASLSDGGALQITDCFVIVIVCYVQDHLPNHRVASVLMDSRYFQVTQLHLVLLADMQNERYHQD